MKVSELTGVLLDYWVARAEGWTFKPSGIGDKLLYATAERPSEWLWLDMFQPSTSWAQGGPIIEREMIELSHDRDWREDGEFGRVWRGYDAGSGYWDGDTPLIAAMRAFVASKFGQEVPDERAASTQEGAKNG